ncbi:MAG: hypothetical protein C4567_05935 [Deltaproteobacteria bacterium]|nr:MAG: hypothetical protein C4567_05935 [Deltaproteobacteria bacterium]
MNYQERHYEYHNRNYTGELLRVLRGEVFHLTSKQAYEKIKKDGFIFHNQKERFALNASSVNSFGRQQGWVCLLDLRNKSDADIREALRSYYFLWPPWFGEYEWEFVEMKLAYLIMDDRYSHKLISYESIDKSAIENKTHVPGVECWYPGDLPFPFIRETILVKVVSEAPKDNHFLYAHHLMGLMSGFKVKG